MGCEASESRCGCGGGVWWRVCGGTPQHHPTTRTTHSPADHKHCEGEHGRTKVHHLLRQCQPVNCALPGGSAARASEHRRSNLLIRGGEGQEDRQGSGGSRWPNAQRWQRATAGFTRATCHAHMLHPPAGACLCATMARRRRGPAPNRELRSPLPPLCPLLPFPRPFKGGAG